MRRRKYLRRLGAVGLVPLAGCADGERDTEEPETRIVTRTVVVERTYTGEPETRIVTRTVPVERTVIKTPEPTPTATPYPNRLNFGDPFKIENGLLITVNKIERSPDDGDAGTSLGDVLLYVTVRNEGDERQSGPDYHDFALLTENRQYGDTTGYASYYSNTRDLLPGREGSGWIEYSTPSEIEISDFTAAAYLHSDFTVIWER